LDGFHHRMGKSNDFIEGRVKLPVTLPI
jgi:hypothetical protein